MTIEITMAKIKPDNAKKATTIYFRIDQLALILMPKKLRYYFDYVNVLFFFK
jgi:hypothetical protein